MKVKFNFIILFAVMLCPASFLFAEDAEVAEEIAYLLEYIQTSDCVFIRNGKAYSGKEGLDHVEKKYKHFKKKIKTSEDFIRYSATKSEMSGKMYYLQLADGKKVLLKDWLFEELARYRKSGKK